MRITFDLPEKMLEVARRAARLRTHRETVVAGLEELIRKGRRQELRDLAGQVRLSVDVSRSRERSRR